MNGSAFQCRFDAAGGASAEANNLAVAQLAGLDPSDVIMGEWSSSVLRPCHYVAADRANHCIVLAIRYSVCSVQCSAVMQSALLFRSTLASDLQ